MEWTLLIDILRFSSIAVLLLFVLILLKKRPFNQQVYLTIWLSVSTISYLLSDWHLIQYTSLQIVVLAGAFSVPVAFWLFSRVFFEDDFEFNFQHFLIGLFVVCINYFLYFSKGESWFSQESLVSIVFSFLSQAVAFPFIFLALFIAFKDRDNDLIEDRIQFRKQFILALTVLIGLTLLAEIALRQTTVPNILEFTQKFAIAILVYYTAHKNLDFEEGFFFAKTKVDEIVFSPEPEMLERFKRLLAKEKIYRQEGLTIKTLADALDEKEYKVRRLINQNLGFRNFNDFLNQYRVQEACEILLDEKQADLTIIEIAYFLGYQSLGPFNAAFKKQTGLTPTGYRKEHSKNTSVTV